MANAIMGWPQPNLEKLNGVVRDLERQAAIGISSILYDLTDPKEVNRTIERWSQLTEDLKILLQILAFLAREQPLLETQQCTLIKYDLLTTTVA